MFLLVPITSVASAASLTFCDHTEILGQKPTKTLLSDNILLWLYLSSETFLNTVSIFALFTSANVFFFYQKMSNVCLSNTFFFWTFSFYGSGQPFTFFTNRGSTVICPSTSESEGFSHSDHLISPAESGTERRGVLHHLAAPLSGCFFIQQLPLLVHAQRSLFCPSALLLQVFLSVFPRVVQSCICVLFHLCDWSIPISVCRADCESPSSFLCSYPVANISLMRNKKHVWIYKLVTETGCSSTLTPVVDIWSSVQILPWNKKTIVKAKLTVVIKPW